MLIRQIGTRYPTVSHIAENKDIIFSLLDGYKMNDGNLTFCLGSIPREFKNFIFKLKLSFLRENHKYENLAKFLDFYGFTLYMIFAIFVKMATTIMANFLKNFKNHIQGDFVKVQEFASAIIFVIFAQK